MKGLPVRGDESAELPGEVAPILVNFDEPGTYRGLLTLAYLIAQQIRAMPLEAMLGEIARAETYGPIVDPTLYREKAKALSEDKEVLAALAGAQKQLLELHRRARR